jgi:hypothetical protein
VLDIRQLREATRERDREQEREEHLHAGQRDAELVQELDQLSVESLLVALVLTASLSHGCRPYPVEAGHSSDAARRPVRSSACVFTGDDGRESMRLTGTTRRWEVSR